MKNPISWLTISPKVAEKEPNDCPSLLESDDTLISVDVNTFLVWDGNMAARDRFETF